MPNKTITINNKTIGNDRPVFIIAEAANSHEGDFEKAKQLAVAATQSGADAVKWQMFTADELTVPTHPKYDHFGKLSFSRDEWCELFALVKDAGCVCAADIFGLESLSLAVDLGCELFKMHSSDVNNLTLLREVARHRKPLLLSTGGSTSDEVSNALAAIREAGCDDIILMHGFQAFPTPLNETNLERIQTLRDVFELPVGYQDHCDGDLSCARALPLMALGYGVCCIEKHITLDRSLKGIDHHSSLDPDEFADMVNMLREAEQTRGAKEYVFSVSEEHYRKGMKKSPVAVRDIPAGTKITLKDIAWKRTGEGPGTLHAHDLDGMITRESITANTVLTPEVLYPSVAVLLAVRMKSSRLPKKALADIEGRPAITHLFDRLKRSRLAKSVIMCTSTLDEDAVLADIARQEGVKVFRGHPEDVMDRFLTAVEPEHVGVIVRVTGDNILVDPEYLDKAILHHLREGADYTWIPDLPSGTKPAEVVALACLRRCYEMAEDPLWSEYMTWYLRRPDVFTVVEMPMPEDLRHPEYRLTLDYPEDLEVLKNIFSVLYKKGEIFGVRDVFDVLAAHPEWIEINATVQQKGPAPEINTRLNVW